MVRVKHQEQQYTHNNNNNNNNNNNDIKSQLAIDTFNIYQNSHNSSCIHRNNRSNIHNVQPPCIDWYLILRVDEDASIGTIRKQYHKFALLLHPDKNKHPKAEFSFKLISQAYKCLSDNARRSSFNLERWKNKCTECNRASHAKQEADSSSSWRNQRSRETQHDFKALREQLKEEARVIENCMKLNRASKNEYPVFDPSNYANLSYPHRRNQHFPNKNGANPWSVQKENVNSNYGPRRNRCENPVFELKTGCRNLNINSTSAFVSS